MISTKQFKLIVLLFTFIYQHKSTNACFTTLAPASTTTVTTTPAPLCCPALNGQNYPRERPPAGSSAAGFDQCAILDRHSAKGYCPRSGMIVCFAAPFTNAAETVLQFIGSNQAVLATFTGHRKATADVICSSQGQWLVAGSNGGSVPFSFLTCSQDTLFTNDNVDVDDILEYRNSGGYGRNQNEDRYSRRRSDESGKSSDSEDDDFRL